MLYLNHVKPHPVGMHRSVETGNTHPTGHSVGMRPCLSRWHTYGMPAGTDNPFFYRAIQSYRTVKPCVYKI
jgi:hypothetical protein